MSLFGGIINRIIKLFKGIANRIMKLFKSDEQQAYDETYKERCIELARNKGVKDAEIKYEYKKGG